MGLVNSNGTKANRGLIRSKVLRDGTTLDENTTRDKVTSSNNSPISTGGVIDGKQLDTRLGCIGQYAYKGKLAPGDILEILGINNLNDGSDKDFSNINLDLGFHGLNEVENYEELQILISQKIPTEGKRPTIKIAFTYGDPKSKNAKSLGVVGGMGPLSDASLMKKVFEKVKEDKNASGTFYLMSSPPPRGKTLFGKRNLVNYCKEMEKFLGSDKFDEYVLAGNTGHANKGAFEFLTKLTADITKGAHKSKLYNLTHKLAENLDKKDNILLLQTTQAREKGLYQKIFKEKDVKFQQAPEKDQDKLQKFVDSAKRGSDTTEQKLELIKLYNPELSEDKDSLDKIVQGSTFKEYLAEKFSDYILSEAKKGGCKSIGLNCTDFQIGLGEKGLNYLQDKAGKIGINIIDSEDKFADIMAGYIKGSENPASNAAQMSPQLYDKQVRRFLSITFTPIEPFSNSRG